MIIRLNSELVWIDEYVIVLSISFRSLIVSLRSPSPITLLSKTILIVIFIIWFHNRILWMLVDRSIVSFLISIIFWRKQILWKMTKLRGFFQVHSLGNMRWNLIIGKINIFIQITFILIDWFLNKNLRLFCMSFIKFQFFVHYSTKIVLFL